MNKSNPALLFSIAAAAALFAVPALAQSPKTNPLPTGKKITQPPLGTQVNVGSLPMNMILTPDGKYAISTDMGFREFLVCVNATTGKIAQPITAPAPIAADGSPTGAPTSNSILQFGAINGDGSYGPPGLYYGLAVQSNGDGTSTLYAAQGADNKVAVVTVGADGSLTLKNTFTLGAGDFAAGLSLDKRGNLFVAVNETYPAGAVANIITPASLLTLDATSGALKSRYSFFLPVGLLADGKTPFSPTNFPLAVAATSAGKVYISSQRDGKVYVVDASDPANPKAGAIPSVTTGEHPISLLLNRSQDTLYVANAHSETVSAVSTATDTIASTIVLPPADAHGLPGFTPTGLALTPDEKQLYVSLGDANAIAVVNLVAGSVTGYIPTGWYPTAVVASPFKKQILVANAKGTQTRYPNPAYQQFNFAGQYGLNLIEGTVQTIPVPNTVQLGMETQQVISNNRLAEIGTASPANVTAANPLSAINLKAGGIKHVIYIVKENRTYDQVLGDLPQGNGDPSLVLFGKNITPNLHAIASRFVLLDNFFDCGEASGDGWPWSTQGQASEYVIKNLPYNYSGRGRNYDFEGANNNYPVGGFPATDPYGKSLVPNSPFHDPTNGGVAPAITDVSEAPGGHIWDDARANIDLTGTGLTTKYRNYGFFALFGDNAVTPDNYPTDLGLRPAGHDLGGITDIDFRRYDAAYADSEGPLAAFNAGNSAALYPTKTYGHYNMPSRFTEWNREFQKMLAQDQNGSTVPAFETVRFMHDHTQGLSAGRHTPQAEVADNDYAVGQLVDAISHSKIWNSTAIFVIEDDAQDGPDHVDAHRSTCYVISPYIKRASVDHTFYNTDSVLKTMELLLNVPPMNQYDAIATPILDFAGTPAPNGDVYTATLPDLTLLGTIASTSKTNPFFSLEQLSAKMDFLHPDSAPSGLLNEVIWKSIKGVHSRMPAPRHSGLRLAPKTAPHAAVKAHDED
jgi:DNA-binding beta-propeller fold protein YncE